MPHADAAPLYARLEDRILARDQVGASETYYDLLRADRPLAEIIADCVRIHAPYTHVPYHERIDDGYPNFVNNDHCLLSARATINLARLLPGSLAALPMAQTIWYIPTGLDIWNQKIGQAPGHYMRGFRGGPVTNPPAPAIYWPDQQPIGQDGPIRERLSNWLTAVHRGQVLDAYRLFLGLMEDTPHRKEVLAELVFAGLIDVQDRALYNRSYTTGHKSFRARATVELGNFIGWDNAHHVLYAGALDMAVGPRWYSTYEMACNAIKMFIDGEDLHAVPYAGASARETAILQQTEPLNQEDATRLTHAIIREPEPGFVPVLTGVLLAGKGPRRILDTIQIAAAQVVIETATDTNFSLPQHCYEYCSTLGWFWDNFDHPLRLKLLYLAAAYLNHAAWHQAHTGDLNPAAVRAPAGASAMTAGQILDHVDAAILALNGPEAMNWVQAYLDHAGDRAPLVQRLALLASRIGNDPHNQEIAQCMLQDYGKNRSPDRDRLLLAAAQHTAVHRKYGEFLEASRRFGQAMDLPALSIPAAASPGRRRVHPQNLPDIPVRVFDAAADHEAMILRRIRITPAACSHGAIQRLIDSFARLHAQRQQRLALPPRIPDRPAREHPIMLVRQQHDADRLGQHHARRLVVREARVHRAAQCFIKPGGRGQIAHRQIHENHLGHGSLLPTSSGPFYDRPERLSPMEPRAPALYKPA